MKLMTINPTISREQPLLLISLDKRLQVGHFHISYYYLILNTMSLEHTVYCKSVSKDLIPRIMERLNEFDMVTSIYPGFRFDIEKDGGFLPFKFSFKNPPFEILRGKELRSGFEIYLGEFNLQEEKEKLNPKLSFIDKLLGKKKQEIEFAPPEIEARLKECKISVSFVWGGSDSFASRFVLLVSAILTELTNGVSYFEDGTWYDNNNIVENAFQEVIEYEQSIPEEKLDF
jgi:hypothetical protein